MSGSQFRKLLVILRKHTDEHIRIHTLPGLSHLVNGRVSIDQIRKVEISDLLRRKPVHLDHTPVRRQFEGKTVMVVGGGGSIGLELCKQIARFHPGCLVVIDSSEFNLYKADDELRKKYPNLSMSCLVADAAQMALMRRFFAQYRPDFVFHAAAYKHVPLMEISPWAAVTNNLQSTLVLTELSGIYRVKHFILISSDKAVRPTSVMGATKRICELITLAHHRIHPTNYTAVRFGNVLGSSGSVIPKFAQQIAEGGPVTVTHPEMTRYFMLVSEAVELVLQVSAVGENGNIHVLDMGDPIRIADLARHMIELSGLTPDEDIEIVYTGLRPGEKLFESLYFEGGESATQVPNLLVLKPHETPGLQFLAQICEFACKAGEMDPLELLVAIKKFVPEYQPAEFASAASPSITKPEEIPTEETEAEILYA